MSKPPRLDEKKGGANVSHRKGARRSSKKKCWQCKDYHTCEMAGRIDVHAADSCRRFSKEENVVILGLNQMRFFAFLREKYFPTEE